MGESAKALLALGLIGFAIAAGVSWVEIAASPYVPHEYQGKTGSFDVAAAVRYPEGRGRMLRFRDGMAVGKTSLDGWQVTLTVAGLLAGRVVMNNPAKFNLNFPAAVSTETRNGWPA